MTDLRELLQEHDPAKDGRELASDELSSMREHVVQEAERPSQRRFRPIRWVTAAALLFLLVTSSWIWLRQGVSEVPAQTEVEQSERRTRQVQFSTPGGTRIIWLLDSEFEV